MVTTAPIPVLRACPSPLSALVRSGVLPLFVVCGAIMRSLPCLSAGLGRGPGRFAGGCAALKSPLIASGAQVGACLLFCRRGRECRGAVMPFCCGTTAACRWTTPGRLHRSRPPLGEVDFGSGTGVSRRAARYGHAAVMTAPEANDESL